ncbi:SCO2583 family membrane protein [Streptomyces sp. NPDC006658]|uniref:SCO2583 family membrane protein n=1 Tax=Streptomyces sp. NPDC006658 TaxID=3156900 RepID=UPI0033F16238
MGGPGDPPEGTPEGGPGGAEDEYRSVVFDESFVRAARLQESSAAERMADHAPAVRRRPPLHRGLARQAVLLVLLIALAFGTAIYMGVRHPYGSAQARRTAEALRMTVIPLAPQGRVPGAADTERLFARSPAAHFETGAEGIPLPPSRSTAHFSDSQVVTALTTVKDYLVRSSLDPDVLAGREVRPARALVDSGQLDQFDRSFGHPAADGRHAPTGWVVRIDPARARLADDRVRVFGTLKAGEADAATLEVFADHTFVYALRPAGAASDVPASLFTVRRELTFRFDRDDLRTRQVQLITAYVQAGPLACAEDASAYLRPLLAGQTARTGGPAGTDPYDTDSPAALCGTLAAGAQPKV